MGCGEGMRIKIKIKKDCRLQTIGWRKRGGIRIKMKMKGGLEGRGVEGKITVW